MLFKIVHGKVGITPSDLGLVPADSRTRASHRHKFKHKGGHRDQTKFSMIHRTVPEWNRLPATLAEAESVDIFKTGLAKAHNP